MGGFNYLLNLLAGLARFESVRVCPFLFCGDDAPDDDIAAFEAIEGITIIRSYVFNKKNRRNALFYSLLTGVDLGTVDCFKQNQIDVIFESATFHGWRLNLPTIAWFPDLQHRQMPELFPRMRWFKREIGFRFQLLTGRCILLSSESARKDLMRFYPNMASKTEVLRFPAKINESDLITGPHELLSLYSLPKVFAFLPNQFWKHKNHAVVIEALGILRKKGLSFTVVATGNPKDHRYPNLYRELEQRMRMLDVAGNFHMLGMVPRSHLIALLRICTVLINPSRFEGWSTTVEEGKVFGVPMILSDLPVHREQAGNKAVYFAVDDAFQLAAYLESCLNGEQINPREIQVDSDLLLKDFACRFATIVEQIKEEFN